VACSAAALFSSPPAADAARVVAWTTRSAFVDPAAPTPFNRPPGVAPRPNALKVNIYLPDGYDGRHRFPILWLLHGHGDAYDSWGNERQGDLLSVAAGIPAIVVMPEGAQGWYTDWWSGGQRRPGWESYYLRELMPLVEKRLKILPGRQYHAIAGLSMGGEGAAYLAEQRPGYFGSLATFSGPLSIQRPEYVAGFPTQGQVYSTVFGPTSGFYATAHNPTALAPALAHTRVFVACGNGLPAVDELGNTFGMVAETDLQLHAIDFAHATRAAGADTSLTIQQGIHAWRYWRKDLAAAIRWGLFRATPAAPPTWSYQTVDQHAHAWDLTLDFSTAPATIERFARDGNRLSAAGVGTVKVTTAGGRRFTDTLPFDRMLPAPRKRRR
jgi:S-formylglutathione hydrolase FrmB